MAFLFGASPAFAQFTTVTATVTDPNGIPYAGGTMSAVLVPGASGGYTLSGQPYSGRVGPVTLDGNGNFTANFGDVTLITPGSPQWQITIDSNQGGIEPPLGTGPQTFTFTSTGTTISGSSVVNISASLNALAPKLTNITVGAGSVTSVAATAPIVGTPNPIVGAGTISCPTCAATGQTNVFGAFLQDFSASTMEIPEAAGFTTNADSTIGLDTTNNNVHLWVDSADSLAAAEASAIAANTIPKATNSTQSLLTASLATDNATTFTYTGTGGFSGPSILINGGSVGSPSIKFNETSNNGFYSIANGIVGITASGSQVAAFGSNFFRMSAAYPIGWSPTTGDAAANDTAFSRLSANKVGCGNGTQADVSCTFQAGAYATGTNCSSSASPAVCGSAAAGSVVIAAASTTVTVNTSAVTANSQILLLADDTLGTKLSVTCNSTLATLIGGLAVTARTGGTSFQITSGATPAVNPLCISYLIVN